MFVRELKEEEILSEDVVRGAVDRLLNDSMTTNGRVDVARMSKMEIEYAIHMLRRYRAIKFGAGLEVI